MSRKQDKPLSEYDQGGVLKSVHDDNGQYLRTNDVNVVVDKFYTRYTVTYDSTTNLPTQIKYYDDMSPEISKVDFTGVSAASLDGKYFNLYSAVDNKQYYVWYNVSGGSVDPTITNATGIQVDIETGDIAAVISFATATYINSVASLDFDSVRLTDATRITNKKNGDTTSITDGDTGASFSTPQEGTSTLIETLDIEYSSDGHPIYLNQELKGYTFNVVEGKFELQRGDTFNVSGNSAQRVVNEGVYGYQHIPNIIENILGITVYDNVETTVSGNIETITYYNSTTPVMGIAITYNNETWSIVEVSVSLNFILQENGDFLLQENGDKLVLDA